jgi:hypothetical protein
LVTKQYWSYVFGALISWERNSSFSLTTAIWNISSSNGLLHLNNKSGWSSFWVMICILSLVKSLQSYSNAYDVRGNDWKLFKKISHPVENKLKLLYKVVFFFCRNCIVSCIRSPYSHVYFWRA